MESQLITIAIKNLSIEDFDEISLKAVQIDLLVDSYQETLSFPFEFAQVPSSSFGSNKIFLKFSYKGVVFGTSSVTSKGFFESQYEFQVESTGKQSLSPEKQRPLADPDALMEKTIGKGILSVVLQENQDFVSEIALDLHGVLQGHGEISANTAEHFRVLITGLNFKLKSLFLLQKRLTHAEKQNFSHIKARESLENSLKEANESLKSLEKQQELLLHKADLEKNAIQAQLTQKENDFREKCLVENQLNGEILIQKGKIEQLTKENKNFSDMQAMIDKMLKDFKGLEVERDIFRKDFSNTIKAFECEICAKDLEISEIAQENLQLEKKLQEKGQEIHDLLNKNDEKQRKIEFLTSTQKELEFTIKSYENLEKKSAQMELLSISHQKECVSTQNQLESACKAFSSEIQKLAEEKAFLQSKNIEILENSSKISQSLQEKTSQFRAEQVISQDLRAKSVIIQQKLLNTMDISKIFQQIKYLSTYASEFRDKLVEDNDSLVSISLLQAQDCLNLFRVIGQIRDIIEDRDNEINILRELIAELQSKTVYYPVKDDPVDEAIADYLNSRSEPLPILFIREEYGCYLFGTKRVFIKLENNKITSIF